MEALPSGLALNFLGAISIPNFIFCTKILEATQREGLKVLVPVGLYLGPAI